MAKSNEELTALAERLQAMAAKADDHQLGTLAQILPSVMTELVARAADLSAAARVVREMAKMEALLSHRHVEIWGRPGMAIRACTWRAEMGGEFFYGPTLLHCIEAVKP